MKHVWLALMLLPGFATQPTTAADANSPGADAAPQPPSPPVQSPKERSAIKLAGLVTFVGKSCPELATDDARYKVAVTALGLSPDELATGDRKMASLNYAAVYQSDVKANCARAQAQFGVAGKTLPGLFHPK